MSKKETFNTIKSTIENIAKTIEITNNTQVVIIGFRGDYKYQRDYVEKVLYCSYDQAEAIVREVVKQCKDIFDNDRRYYITHMYSIIANTPSSLVSNIAYQAH